MKPDSPNARQRYDEVFSSSSTNNRRMASTSLYPGLALMAGMNRVPTGPYLHSSPPSASKSALQRGFHIGIGLHRVRQTLSLDDDGIQG